MAVFDSVKNTIVEQCAVNEDIITADATIENIGIDSLDVVDVIMALEDEYQIKIPDEDIEEIETINDLVEIIENLI